MLNPTRIPSKDQIQFEQFFSSISPQLTLYPQYLCSTAHGQTPPIPALHLIPCEYIHHLKCFLWCQPGLKLSVFLAFYFIWKVSPIELTRWEIPQGNEKENFKKE